ncbi:MAG: hypothetical protein IVW52_05040 [Acidimicrobiales bacterium]|nr:hypothetical protein [Acidimicrobiales bacterium]
MSLETRREGTTEEQALADALFAAASAVTVGEVVGVLLISRVRVLDPSDPPAMVRLVSSPEWRDRNLAALLHFLHDRRLEIPTRPPEAG